VNTVNAIRRRSPYSSKRERFPKLDVAPFESPLAARLNFEFPAQNAEAFRSSPPNFGTPATSIDAQDSAGFKRWVCCLIAKDSASRIWWKPWDGILA
jgi:hypothetical protein